MEHYAIALREMFTLSQRSEGEIEFERILAALWLMVIYELNFGDGCAVGLSGTPLGGRIVGYGAASSNTTT
jgi:hypothetical protein